MTNLDAFRNTCNLICNTFFPDTNTLLLVLFNNNMDASAEAKPRDAAILKMAIQVVRGFVEKSRAEGDLSITSDSAAIEKNIIYWAREYGLKASEFASSSSSIRNGSNLV